MMGSGQRGCNHAEDWSAEEGQIPLLLWLIPLLDVGCAQAVGAGLQTRVNKLSDKKNMIVYDLLLSIW